ncbi:MAG: hypothetical protein EPN21_16300 [Methylococcaceae bacterium]|nr:MAG: hypothetical protein EPN21_16300 [Methylococcaceae bacterium]
MIQNDLAKAKDPDLRASLQAMKRAAEEARKLAIQTNTGIVILQNEKVIHLSADELQRTQTK